MTAKPPTGRARVPPTSAQARRTLSPETVTQFEQDIQDYARL
jgi:hypothetical protein